MKPLSITGAIAGKRITSGGNCMKPASVAGASITSGGMNTNIAGGSSATGTSAITIAIKLPANQLTACLKRARHSFFDCEQYLSHFRVTTVTSLLPYDCFIEETISVQHYSHFECLGRGVHRGGRGKSLNYGGRRQLGAPRVPHEL